MSDKETDSTKNTAPFLNLSYEDYREFMVEFEKENDRAAVILGAAKLDLILGQILKKALLPNDGNSDDLIDGDHPLSTFSSKIKLVHRLGFIDDELRRALNLIRKIRNDFAHEVSGATLNAGPHRDRVVELSSELIKYEAFGKFLEKWTKDGEDADTSAVFRAVLTLIYIELQILLDNIGRVTPPYRIALIYSKWSKK